MPPLATTTTTGSLLTSHARQGAKFDRKERSALHRMQQTGAFPATNPLFPGWAYRCICSIYSVRCRQCALVFRWGGSLGCSEMRVQVLCPWRRPRLDPLGRSNGILAAYAQIPIAGSQFPIRPRFPISHHPVIFTYDYQASSPEASSAACTLSPEPGLNTTTTLFSGYSSIEQPPIINALGLMSIAAHQWATESRVALEQSSSLTPSASLVDLGETRQLRNTSAEELSDLRVANQPSWPD